MKIVAKTFNLLSINSFIGSPYFHKRNATMPNLIPLAIKLVTVNNTRFIPVAPLAIVITLYGNGVIPAVRTTIAPYSLKL